MPWPRSLSLSLFHGNPTLQRRREDANLALECQVILARDCSLARHSPVELRPECGSCASTPISGRRRPGELNSAPPGGGGRPTASTPNGGCGRRGVGLAPHRVEPLKVPPAQAKVRGSEARARAASSVVIGADRWICNHSPRPLAEAGAGEHVAGELSRPPNVVFMARELGRLER